MSYSDKYQDVMDEIITIVIVAAAIIFKVVSKKLGSAGSGDEVFPTIPVDPDMRNYPETETDMATAEEEFKDPFFRTKPVVDEVVIEEAERALPVQPVHKPMAPAKPVEVKAQTPILEEEQPKQKERIDPKKLIVYSEIMKPKYME